MLGKRGLLPCALRRLLASSLFSSRSHSSCARQHPSLPSVKPPVAKKIPFTCSAHGKTWEDPYRWMSDTNDSDLVEYLSRENAYAEAFMADASGLRQRLVGEMRSRMPAKVSTPPECWGPWSYYQYIPEGKEYPVLCRRLRHLDSFAKAILSYMRSYREEILLDWNEIAEQYGMLCSHRCLSHFSRSQTPCVHIGYFRQ